MHIADRPGHLLPVTRALAKKHARLLRIVAYVAWAALGACALPAAAQPRTPEQITFQRYSSCPSTGLRNRYCPGYQIAYKVALCAGGADRWTNMAWVTEPVFQERLRRDDAACRQRRK